MLTLKLLGTRCRLAVLFAAILLVSAAVGVYRLLGLDGAKLLQYVGELTANCQFRFGQSSEANAVLRYLAPDPSTGQPPRPAGPIPGAAYR
jgi:hypothetical protein